MNPIESHLLLILGKGLALSAVFLVLALVLLRGRSAQAVSLYWRTALAGLLIVPLVSLFLPWWHIAPPVPKPDAHAATGAETALSMTTAPARPDAVVIVPLAEETVDAIEAPLVAEAEIPTAAVEAPLRLEWRSTLLLGIWALGFAVILGRWMVSWRRGNRMVRSGRNASSAMWDQELARSGENGPPVRLVISEDVNCPIVFGLRRHVLLLPPDSESWDGEKRRQVLAHELCHVRRRDSVFLLLARLTIALHWVNPLAWLAAKRLRLAEERTADDAVLAEGRDPAEYASLLAGFARRGVSVPKGLPLVAPSMAGASTVRSRVQRILDKQQHRGAPRPLTHFGFGLLVCTAVLVAGGISFSPVAAEEPAAREPDGENAPAIIDGDDDGEAAVLAAHEFTLSKARNIIIPSLDINEATLEEAVDYLRQRSRELDPFEPDPDKKGLNFVIIGAETAKRQIPSLQLKNIPLASALDFICQQTETTYEATEFALTIKDAEGAAAAPEEKPLPAAEARVMAKLKGIIIPAVVFEEATLSEGLEFLRHRSRELDVAEKDPKKKGLNIVLRGKDLGARKIKSMNLRNVPLDTVMKYVCELTNTAYKVDAVAVTIVDQDKEPANELVTRTFAVPPTFQRELLNRVEGDGGKDPFAPQPKMRPLIDLLRDAGVDFGAGASVSYVPETSRLVVRLRPGDLDLVTELVDEMMGDVPIMVKMRIELYEVPKAEALKIVKQNADKSEGSEAYRMVEALVAQKKARLLSTPTTMVRPGQRGTLQSGSELDYVAAYLEKDGQDMPVMRKALVGSNISIEPNIGMDGQVLDIRYELTMTRGEPKVVRRKVKAPVSGREVEVETVFIDTLTLKQGLTTLTAQTQFLGMMQSSMNVDNPDEIMAFLTATVTKVMR